MNPSLQAVLERFLDQADDPVEGALIVARIIDPDADADWARAELAGLAASLEAAGRTQPEAVIDDLAERGFQGTAEGDYGLKDSVLDHVLRSRQGLPISLGVVLLGIADRLGLNAAGVNFPGHFLVTVDSLLIDPKAMAPTSIKSCRGWLQERELSEVGAFAIAQPRDIVARMLNNVQMMIQGRGDLDRALEISDYQLLIAPDAYVLRVERADIWLGLGSPEMFVEELEKAAELAPDESIEMDLLDRIGLARQYDKSAIN